jgi:methionyl aminopeptidase
MEKHEIENYKKAGEIASKTKALALKLIKPKMPLLEIAEKIEEEIAKLGGKPAFPTNLSINEIAAHYTPSSTDKTLAEGLLKIDLGVEVKGYIADLAFSIDLTSNGEHKKMIELNEKILDDTLATLKPNSQLSEIGTNIQKNLESHSHKDLQFSIIHNLSGHSLGEYDLHAGINIPNNKNNSTISLKNSAIAIEPFLTTGEGEVYDGRPSEIYIIQSDLLPRDNESRKLLEFIKKEYKTLPFCKRWLEKAGFKKILFPLAIMSKQDIIHNFPVLVEKSKKPVSQSEHTVLITDKEVIVTTK